MATILVGLESDHNALLDAARRLDLDVSQASVLTDGLLEKGAVNRWVGVNPPAGDDDLLVNLRAPEQESREASTDWGYVSEGRWSLDPSGASSCFNYSDLLAVRIP